MGSARAWMRANLTTLCLPSEALACWGRRANRKEPVTT
jgi:hypothetical protein